MSGSELYDIKISIRPLAKDKWRHVKESCAGQIGSLLELLQGRLSDHVMGIVTDKDRGLFPLPGEIDLDCSCPDWADMCKHVAAVLYGIGARLDEKPELLFVLRGVRHAELVGQDAARAVVSKAKKTGRRTLAESELSEVFGIDVAAVPTAPDAPDVADPQLLQTRRPPRLQSDVRREQRKQRSDQPNQHPPSEATASVLAARRQKGVSKNDRD